MSAPIDDSSSSQSAPSSSPSTTHTLPSSSAETDALHPMTKLDNMSSPTMNLNNSNRDNTTLSDPKVPPPRLISAPQTTRNSFMRGLFGDFGNPSSTGSSSTLATQLRASYQQLTTVEPALKTAVLQELAETLAMSNEEALLGVAMMPTSPGFDSDIDASRANSNTSSSSSSSDPQNSSKPTTTRHISRNVIDGVIHELIALLDTSAIPVGGDSSTGFAPHIDPEIALMIQMGVIDASELGIGIHANALSPPNPEVMILACRCLINMVDAMPTAVSKIVYADGLKHLISKLHNVEYIDLAEIVLSLLLKISHDYPGFIVREHGLKAVLQYIDFFATNVQRTAMLIVSNCCRSLPRESFDLVVEVITDIEQCLIAHDPKVVEYACLSWSRIVSNYARQSDKLERLVSVSLLEKVLQILKQTFGDDAAAATSVMAHNFSGSGGNGNRNDSSSKQSGTKSVHNHLLRFVSTVAKYSPTLAFELLKLNIVETLHIVLTGKTISTATNSSYQDTEELDRLEEFELVNGVLSRPREWIFEVLTILDGFLPSLPTTGIFDTSSSESDHNIGLISSHDDKQSSSSSTTHQFTENTNIIDVTDTIMSDSDHVSSNHHSDVVMTYTSVSSETSSQASSMPLDVHRAPTTVIPDTQVIFLGSDPDDLDDDVHGEDNDEDEDEEEDDDEEEGEQEEKEIEQQPSNSCKTTECSCSNCKLVELTLRKPEGNTMLLSRKDDEEQLNQKRVALMKENAEVVKAFNSILLPLMLHIFEAAVNLAVRQKVLTCLLKIVLWSSGEMLYDIMKNAPFASFLSRILSKREHSSLTISAVQLIRLMLEKLPDVYRSHFQREGVLRELLYLSSQTVSNIQQPDARSQDTSNRIDQLKLSIEALERVAQTIDQNANRESSGACLLPMPLSTGVMTDTYEASGGERNDHADILTNGLRIMEAFKRQLQGLSADTALDMSTTSLTSDNAVVSIKDVKWLKRNAQTILAVCVLDEPDSTADSRIGQGFSNAAELMNTLKWFAQKLQEDNASMSSETLKERLYELRKYFRLDIFAITTYEFLHSGLLTSFVELFNRSESDAWRRQKLRIFIDAFVWPHIEPQSSDPRSRIQYNSALIVLLRRLQDLVTQLETFDIESPSGITTETMRQPFASMLTRQLRIKLVSDEDSPHAVPSQGNDMIVGVHAVTTMKTLEDFLRARLGKPSSTEIAASSPLTANIITGTHNGRDVEFRLTEGAVTLKLEEEDESVVPSQESSSLSTTESIDVSSLNEEDGINSAGTIWRRAPNVDVNPLVNSQNEDQSSQFSDIGERVLTDDTQWYISLRVDDNELDPCQTIYSAVYHHARAADQSVKNVWNNIHVVKYRRVIGARSHPVQHEQIFIVPCWHSFEDSMPAKVSASITKDSTLVQVLTLMRCLYTLCTRTTELLNEDHIPESIHHPLPVSHFVNAKLTAKVNRQMEDPLIVAGDCLPEWCQQLPMEFPFLFPFETRYRSLQISSFGYSRCLHHWVNTSGQRDGLQPSIGRIQRQKVRIHRDRMLESAVKVFSLFGQQRSILEVEYFDEVGTGLGPTLEFYSAVSHEYQKKQLMMWREDETPSDVEHVKNSQGLFPAPISPQQANSKNAIKIYNLFRTLGTFCAKALLDGRLTDLPFNTYFLERVVYATPGVHFRDLKRVDQRLAQSLQSLQDLQVVKKAIYADSNLSAAEKEHNVQALKVNDVDVVELCLDFTLPGAPDYELKMDGANIPVTIWNVEEYVTLVLEATLNAGIVGQLSAFTEGFNGVFVLRKMSIFTVDELSVIFGGVEEDWSYDELRRRLKADHGYSHSSKVVGQLLEVLCTFEVTERRKFLQFLTGCPKLPVGGFKTLTPPFTVVRKAMERGHNADDYLPSVMTCVNYLKIPEYSSKDVLRYKLLMAIEEGQGSFHLS